MTDYLATDLRSWTADIQAEQTCAPLRAGRVCVALGVTGFVLAVIVGLIGKHINLPAVLVPVFFIAGFIVVIVGSVLHKKARSTALHCSRCRKQMDYSEYNYPADSPRLSRFEETIPGDNGRLYVRYQESHGSQGGGHPVVSRLMQGARTCSKCERYVITDKMIFKKVGATRSDALDAERKAKRIDGLKKKYAGKKFAQRKANN